jgi:hypothetical protein
LKGLSKLNYKRTRAEVHQWIEGLQELLEYEDGTQQLILLKSGELVVIPCGEEEADGLSVTIATHSADIIKLTG